MYKPTIAAMLSLVFILTAIADASAQAVDPAVDPALVNRLATEILDAHAEGTLDESDAIDETAMDMDKAEEVMKTIVQRTQDNINQDIIISDVAAALLAAAPDPVKPDLARALGRSAVAEAIRLGIDAEAVGNAVTQGAIRGAGAEAAGDVATAVVGGIEEAGVADLVTAARTTAAKTLDEVASDVTTDVPSPR